MNTRNFAFFLAFLAAIIYGISYTIAKDVMPQFVKPYGFIFLRVSGGCLIYWLVGIFIKNEKITFLDYPKILLASIFGVALNMLSFFKGLSLTSPISASVIMVTTPIMVLIFASLFLKEKASKIKLAGIFIGLFGAILLITYGHNQNSASNAMLGNLLVFINASSYALYLILVKNLTKKYHPITLAKWLYLFGFILIIPFSFSEFNQINWVTIPHLALFKIGFIILFTTVITNLFNLVAIKKLNPTTFSIFIYLQPVIASIYALIVGSDSLNIIKILSTILIFIGVYLVTKKPIEESNS